MKNLSKLEAMSLISSGYRILNNKKLNTVNSFYDFYFYTNNKIIRIERFSGKGVLYSSIDEALDAMGLNHYSSLAQDPVQIIYDHDLKENLDNYIDKLYDMIKIDKKDNFQINFEFVKIINIKVKKINFYKEFESLYIPLVAFISKVLINETNGHIVLSLENKRDFLVKNGDVFYNPYRGLFKLYSLGKIKLDLEALILTEYYTA